MENRLGEVLCREQSRGRGCVIEEKGTDSNLSLM